VEMLHIGIWEWQKMAKSRILDEIFNAMCIFEKRKNGVSGGKILWNNNTQ